MMQVARKASPFLKWAGGKGQLSTQIDGQLPDALKNGQITRYVEPFIGGGAMLFHIAQHYPVESYYISDTNAELILLYQCIKEDVGQLIDNLALLQKRYYKLPVAQRDAFFYETREKLNKQLPSN